MRAWFAAVVLAGAIPLAAPVAVAQGVTADPANASVLASLCQASDRSFCYGYVTAAAQFYRAITIRGTVDEFVCPGREVTQEEAVTVFLNWHAQNAAAAASEPAIDGLFGAWMAAFPCR